MTSSSIDTQSIESIHPQHTCHATKNPSASIIIFLHHTKRKRSEPNAQQGKSTNTYNIKHKHMTITKTYTIKHISQF